MAEGASMAAQEGIPTLILKGEMSRFWRKDEFEREKKRYRSSSLITFEEIRGVGHALPFEKTEEFVKITKDFIARWEGVRRRLKGELLSLGSSHP
jgi:pimeloyl-ACP methyl ester carboxylesterase